MSDGQWFSWSNPVAWCSRVQNQTLVTVLYNGQWERTNFFSLQNWCILGTNVCSYDAGHWRLSAKKLLTILWGLSMAFLHFCCWYSQEGLRFWKACKALSFTQLCRHPGCHAGWRSKFLLNYHLWFWICTLPTEPPCELDNWYAECFFKHWWPANLPHPGSRIYLTNPRNYSVFPNLQNWIVGVVV
jgi:hypothetical protein